MPSRKAFNMADVGGEAASTPTRACPTVVVGCCARAASGHAAAEATNVMKARRFTAQRLPVFPSNRVAQLAMASETAALRDFNPPLPAVVGACALCCGQPLRRNVPRRVL